MSVSQRVPMPKESYARGITSNAGLADDRARAETIANGAAAAAILASGIGTAAFGLIVVLSESIEAFHDLMAINSSVGPLSGKSTFAVLIWLATWGLLHLLLRRREVNFKATAIVAALLVTIGVICTFPPFFMLFAYE